MRSSIGRFACICLLLAAGPSSNRRARSRKAARMSLMEPFPPAAAVVTAHVVTAAIIRLIKARTPVPAVHA